MVWRLRLDFSDFREMQAPREVRASFDVGFTMLHELSHGLGYKDAASLDELGECEKLINRARTELNLPLRDQYFGDTLPLSRSFVSIRLRFRRGAPAPGAARGRAQYLFFIVTPDRDASGPAGPLGPISPPGMETSNCGKRR
jgi:hypothetical protein